MMHPVDMGLSGHVTVETMDAVLKKVRTAMDSGQLDNVSFNQSWNLSLIHISEPTRLLSVSSAVFCLKKKKRIL